MKHANAFVLRTAEDAQGIRHHVSRARARRAVVVGGGVLGVEAADALHHLGLKVTLLQRADRLMNAQLDAEGGAMLRGYLESIGIQVVTHASVSQYVGEPLIKFAQLAHGPQVRGDVFVAALGIQANTFLAAQAGLELADNGVLVDSRMRTSDPDIYAVGDVAELKGTPRGLWPIGAAHAASAAASMLGDDRPYATPRIVLQLKCDGIDLRSQGDIVPREGDENFHAREGGAWWCATASWPAACTWARRARPRPLRGCCNSRWTWRRCAKSCAPAAWTGSRRWRGCERRPRQGNPPAVYVNMT